MRKYWTIALLLMFALASSGCVTNTYSSDPDRRIKELLNQSEDLRQIDLEVERFWMIDQPSHLAPERVHGGIGSDAPTIPRPTDDPPVPPGPWLRSRSRSPTSARSRGCCSLSRKTA